MLKGMILTIAICGLSATAFAQDNSSKFNEKPTANVSQQQSLHQIQADQLHTSTPIHTTLDYHSANDVADDYSPRFQLEQKINQHVLTNQLRKSDQTAQTSVAAAASPPVINITLGQIYNDSLNSTTLEKWYVFNVDTATKLTGLLQQVPLNQNYNLMLFGKPTGETQYVYLAQSSMPNNTNEQLSTIAQPGSYILVVQAIGSATSDAFVIGTLTSPTYDSHEPDDSIWQAPQIGLTEDRVGTLDLFVDVDYFRITANEASSLVYEIQGGNYQAQMLYTDGTVALTLPNNTDATVDLPAQSFYWRIFSPTGTVNPSEQYQFTVKEKPKAIHKLTFFNTSDSHGDNNKFIWNSQLTESSRFGIKNSMNVVGNAYDINDQPIVGAKVRFKISGGIGADTVTVLTTNASGQYSGVIYSPSGLGEFSYQESHVCSRFDLHTLVISDGFSNDGTALPIVETKEYVYNDDDIYTTEDGLLPLYDIAVQFQGTCLD